MEKDHIYKENIENNSYRLEVNDINLKYKRVGICTLSIFFIIFLTSISLLMILLDKAQKHEPNLNISLQNSYMTDAADEENIAIINRTIAKSYKRDEKIEQFKNNYKIKKSMVESKYEHKKASAKHMQQEQIKIVPSKTINIASSIKKKDKILDHLPIIDPLKKRLTISFVKYDKKFLENCYTTCKLKFKTTKGRIFYGYISHLDHKELLQVARGAVNLTGRIANISSQEIFQIEAISINPLLKH